MYRHILCLTILKYNERFVQLQFNSQITHIKFIIFAFSMILEKNGILSVRNDFSLI